MAYRVAQWDQVHENHESRKYERLHYVAMPNNLQGLRYRKIVAHKRRHELFSAWVLILEVASTTPKPWRGWLVRNGRPLCAADLACITGFPQNTFELALDFLSHPEFRWLVLMPCPAFPASPGEPPGTPGDYPGLTPDSPQLARSGQDRSTENNKKGGGGPGEPGKNATSSVNGAPAPAAVAASRTRWASLTKRIKELEGQPEEQLTGEERLELKQNRADLAELERNQRKGKFG